MARPVKGGSTDVSTTIRIIDSSDGTPEEAVEHNSSGIALWYRRSGTGTKQTITPAALASLSTAHTDGGIEHIDDGYYRLDVPDAAFAAGADDVQIGGTVTGMIILGSNHPIVDYTPLTASSDIAGSVWDKATASHTTAGTFGKHLETQLTNINAIQSDLDNGTDGLGALKALIDIVDGVVDDILVDTGTTIPATLATAQADLDIITGVDGAVLTSATETQIDDILTDTGTTIPASIATAQADLDIITDTDGVILGAAAVDLIWDEATSGHTTPGTTGKALTDAGALGDPWATAVPGAYAAGTAGKILGDNLNAVVQDILDAIGTVQDLGGGATLAANLDDMAGTTFNASTDSLEQIKDNLVAGSGLTPLASGTCQTPADNTEAVLASSETFLDDELNGNIIKITSGTGAGQARVITDYTGSTDTAAVTPNWTTTLDNTSVYEIVPGSVNITAVSGTAEDLPTTGDVPTAGAIADSVWDEDTSGHTGSGTFGEQAKTDIDSILTKVTTLDTTKIPDTISLANIRTQADNALSAIYLDQLIANSYDSAAPDGATDSLLNEMTENNGGLTRFTTAALAMATGGTGTVEAIADAVWDEAKSGHTDVGSFGEVLQYIVSAENIGAAVWDDVRSGHTTVGSFGEALTSNEADRDAAIADAVWNEPTGGHVAPGSFGEQAGTDIDAILASVGNVLGQTSLYSGSINIVTTQTDFILTAPYPPDADALNDHIMVIQDASDDEQVDAVRVIDYDGAGGVTLERDPVFTIVPTDKVNVLATTPGISDTRLDAANATALTDIGLDHLVSTSVTGADVADGSIMAALVSDSATPDWDDFNNTLHSLKQISESSQSAAILSTTISAITDQSNLTLADGPDEADALNGCIAVITDVATSTQISIREITDYSATTKLMTLDSDPTYTVATTDIVDIYPARTLNTAAAIRAEIDSNSTELAQLVSDTAAIISTQTSDTAVQALIQTETDKIPSIITTQSAHTTTLGDIETETDKIPATIVTIDAIQTSVDNLGGLELLDTTVSVVDSTTQFRLTAGITDDDALINSIAVFTDVADLSQKSFRQVTDYVTSTNQITVSSAPDFVIAPTDRVQLFAASTFVDAGLLSDLAAVKTETDKIPTILTNDTAQDAAIATIDGYTSAISANQTALLARHTTHDVDIAAVKAKTDLVSGDGDDTNTLAAIAAVQSVVDTIDTTTSGHTTNIGLIDNIQTELGVVDGIVDLVKVETDKIPALIATATDSNSVLDDINLNGVSLSAGAESSLVAAISGTAIGGNNITVSIANYGQLVAGTLSLKEGQQETVTFTSTVEDMVPDLGAANTQLLFGVKTADKSHALRCLDGSFLVETGLQSVQVDISETLAQNLIPGRGEFDLWILYGYDAATGTYTDARLFANGPVKVDAKNVQLTL